MGVFLVPLDTATWSLKACVPKSRQSSEEEYEGNRRYCSSEEENGAGDGHIEGSSDWRTRRMAEQRTKAQSWTPIADVAFSKL